MEASEDDDDYDEDYEDGSSSHNALGRLGCFVNGALRMKELSKG